MSALTWHDFNYISVADHGKATIAVVQNPEGRWELLVKFRKDQECRAHLETFATRAAAKKAAPDWFEMQRKQP